MTGSGATPVGQVPLVAADRVLLQLLDVRRPRATFTIVASSCTNANASDTATRVVARRRSSLVGRSVHSTKSTEVMQTPWHADDSTANESTPALGTAGVSPCNPAYAADWSTSRTTSPVTRESTNRRHSESLVFPNSRLPQPSTTGWTISRSSSARSCSISACTSLAAAGHEDHTVGSFLEAAYPSVIACGSRRQRSWVSVPLRRRGQLRQTRRGRGGYGRRSCRLPVREASSPSPAPDRGRSRGIDAARRQPMRPRRRRRSHPV